ncbi:hypothetical protein B0T22DRAFT_428607 [Podospora appendiculata]|uniref:Uncharacterized protein n=1 Tax=Podospora appendiculata TaxID=314037 RepID=A0AAE0X4M5_9PEZI|nr:hypothetical protein B0T22DRAFT_428607 [Podospora appendiculata]
MHDNRTHPLLEQVPLTVSPFVKLPTATTLPYTYKAMPNSLPPSAAGITATSIDGAPSDPSSRPKYVVSSSGHAAHPDDIIASCRALQLHIAKLEADADAEIRAIDERIRARELAEKRRLAPGWLDSDARLLEPERKGQASYESDAGGAAHNQHQYKQQQQQHTHQYAGSFGREGHGPGGASEMAVPDEGEELDRAFGVLGLGSRS